ncbi:MAG: SMP-30/gluconolactonase/LRE family protein [Phenylobacterium sp.]|uniref:SMP-30/gluconolactonase/LRE family protein n=1 Tax=Phenylobacterium sp. TaxID=1871053 RepID=UPI00273503ED|nr:SMP-30/gluconolactonase/LRE family protein [Phenylobacterium sp.]MDP3749387.1 SMP-30/gluconolactonase/LRE family protein [Phenylobacterium sp.]
MSRDNSAPGGPACHILAEGLRFPEGPAFDRNGDLWCVELQGGSLVRCDPGGAITHVTVGGAPNGLGVGADNAIWFCDAERDTVRVYDVASGRCETAVDAVEGARLAHPNDLAFDTAGNLVFTCPGDSRHAPSGYVCCLTPAGACSVVARDLQFPNGLAFLPDGDLVVAETRRQRLWRGGWDPGGRTWREPRPYWSTSGPIGPDGLAVDAGGRVYAAIYGAGRVEVFDAEGACVETLPTPGENPSNCAFDPSGRLGLVVTETQHGRLLAFPALRPGLALPSGRPWSAHAH